MIVIFRTSGGGPYRVVQCEDQRAADRLAPYQAMRTLEEARALANHLNSHSEWPKKDCAICKPEYD